MTGIWSWLRKPPSRSRNIHSFHGSEEEKINFLKPYTCEKKRKINQETKEMLKNPQIYRVYWWHVVLRFGLEIGFLVGQYFLYGFSVPELYQCKRWPCPNKTDCFVSRPMEKTCLLWLMYGLGASSCLLSISEIFVLGWERLEYAFFCRGLKLTYEEKRRFLAAFAETRTAHQHHQVDSSLEPFSNKNILLQTKVPMKSELMYDNMSSVTTLNSV